MDIFSYLLPKYTIDKTKPIRLISLFSGYDSQKLAFNYLGIDVEHYRAIEFDKYAMQSLNEIHNTNFETNDITKVSADDLGIVNTENITYLLTYSFPCTDLSLAGKRAGMDKESGTRSGLLWEVERLLRETKEKPQILIMENVPQVLSAKGWREWNVFLENLGYSNYAQILNAKNFGIPQNRERCFMVSILGDYSYEFPRTFELKDRLKDFLETNVDEKYYLSEKMMKYVCSRMPMGDNKLNIGINMMNKENKEKIAGTICTSGGNQPNDNFIIENENIEYDKEKGWFGIIDSYNKYMPQDQNVCGVIPAGYSRNQGTMVIEKNNKENCGKSNIALNEVDAVNYYLGTYQFAKSDAFMNGKDRFEPNKEIMDCILTDQKVGVVVKDEMPKLVGGIGEKKSNGGTQFYQQNRIYDSESIAMCHCANIPNGSYNYQLSDLRIRKLTPLECFKLMGVKPSDYEKITCSNAQKYKQAGNSIVTTCLMAIYSQLFDDVDYKYYIEELLKELRVN